MDINVFNAFAFSASLLFFVHHFEIFIIWLRLKEARNSYETTKDMSLRKRKRNKNKLDNWRDNYSSYNEVVYC